MFIPERAKTLLKILKHTPSGSVPAASLQAKNFFERIGQDGLPAIL
jgi:hypothetical protein